MFDISPEQLEAFKSSLRAGQYNLLLGAGISLDSSNSYGKIPSGNSIRDELCDVKGVGKNKSLQKVFELLDEDEVDRLITKRFSNCDPGNSLITLTKFIWKRIFTWNIDDATEAAYRIRGAKQSLIPVHFRDTYSDERSISDLLLVKLHGSVSTPEKGYVFSRDEYIQLMRENSPWMVVLSQYMTSQPFVIIGASMDEVDLDYYLSFRSRFTGRDDQGPSILVEPNPDAVTENECRKHNLLLFRGTASDFFDFCDRLLPNRPTPLELVPTEAANLLPDNLPKADALRFHSDFELVPATAATTSQVSSFLYGHPPSWADLSLGIDISRNITTTLITEVEERVRNTAEETRIFLISDLPGAGKTTVLKRTAFELASRGYHCLYCSALSRLEADKTVSIINKIVGPLVVFVDDFADQVSSIGDIAEYTTKKDIVFVVAERTHRYRYIVQSLSGVQFERARVITLRENDVDQLISNYSRHGLVGDYRALKDAQEFRNRSTKDPIAVACCRILNDYRPLDRITNSLISQCSLEDQDRFVVAALAQNCFAGGLRHEILGKVVSGDGYRKQMMQDHPLPLAFYDRRTNSHVVPQNAVIAENVLKNVSKSDPSRLKKIFVDLANELAPRVNRRTIKQRSPEARLTGRLFDFDSVVELMLRDLAEHFYAETRDAWQWNSRYWEQTALMNLSKARISSDTRKTSALIEVAVHNAKHAVSLERHAFPLTTLAKVLFARMNLVPQGRTQAFSDAFDSASIAIRAETGRRSPHPYVTVFRGAIDYVALGGVMSSTQIESLRNAVRDARKLFPRDNEVATLANDVMQII